MSSLAETSFNYEGVVWTCALLPYRIIICRDAIQYIMPFSTSFKSAMRKPTEICRTSQSGRRLRGNTLSLLWQVVSKQSRCAFA